MNMMFGGDVSAVQGVSYDWGTYDLLVLPTAFPYGGMENPNLTFLNASLLAGDRSLTNVVCHEITHSWAGNYVTNSNWSDFWLNEGFTVYIERLILGEVHRSAAYRHFEILIGYQSLLKTVQGFADQPEYTKLMPNLAGEDPDDSFSRVPYEKGSLFLFSLECLVGLPAMRTWLQSYFSDFRTRSLDTATMRRHFEGSMRSQLGATKCEAEIFPAIRWDAWLTGVGMPPFDISAPGVLDRSLAVKCEQLAARWLDSAEQVCAKRGAGIVNVAALSRAAR
jgi:leukotriene-A4 hydrolase